MAGSTSRASGTLSDADSLSFSGAGKPMVVLRRATMMYPIPKRYREHLFHPFRPVRRKVGLRDVDLEIRSGESLGVVGPNGAGKTTLLKLIGGLLYPTSGSIRIEGFDTRIHESKVRRRVGYVINEERSFYWRLTGIQNLEFFGALDNFTRPRRVFRGPTTVRTRSSK